jgi:2-hydroxy-6-oxonona-2,4-dienedioate hydrolase
MRSMEIDSRWTTVNGAWIHARVGRAAAAHTGRLGDRPPVVLLQGLGVSTRYFVPMASALAADFPVLAPDLPGSGPSDRPSHALDIRELASVLRDWMDAIGLDRPAFIANSMGCQVAIELAITAPERVDKLVLVGPTVDPRWRSVSQQIPRWLLEAIREPLSLWALVIDDYSAFGFGRLLQTARFAVAHRIEEKLPRVAAPTLVVRGERDAFVSLEWAEEVTRLLPNGRMVAVPRAAHAANYSQPQALARLIRPFLSGTIDRSAQHNHDRAREPNVLATVIGTSGYY